MDGVKPPMSKVEEFKQALEPYQQKYGHYLTKIRPLQEFFRFSKPNGDIKSRLEANLSYFQINYAVVFLGVMLLAIFTTPSCLIVISVLALVWVAFLKKNDDPNWQINVGGIELGKTQRWMALSAISALVFLSFVGKVLFSAAFFGGCLVVAHGVMHPVPDELVSSEQAQPVGP